MMVAWVRQTAKRSRFLAVLALMLVLGAGVAQAAWVSLGGSEGSGVEVSVLESSQGRTVLGYTIPGFYAEPVTIAGATYYALTLPGEGNILERGLPELPHVCRSIIIDDRAKMEVRVLETEVEELAGYPVIPSKGNLLRTVDPATVPYTFDSFYGSDQLYPETMVRSGAPYILRDYRGMVVEVLPFAATGTGGALRVVRRLVVEVRANGLDQTNVIVRDALPASVSRPFAEIYSHQFVNWDQARYAPTLESGKMVIITYDAFHDALLPLVEWKNQMGLPTRVVDVSTIGNTVPAIDAYVASCYENEGAAFILLVGDATQIVTPHAAGGASDPTYALIVGSDNYPELFVGRFSAETLAQVETQVTRTLEYEKLPLQDGTWYAKGTGIASNQGPGDDNEYDYQHIGNIRTKLLNYTYTQVDEIYDPNANAAMVTTALNQGRSIIDYCGHGSTTAWTTTGFSNSHVNALQNAGMLPFIFSVACVNGQFEGTTCFAEAWLRASQGGVPTGAVGAYMSSVNQYWDPPMAAQDESIDLLVGDAMRTFGGLCYNGSCLMMDEYGGAGAEMYLTWHIFGDPSLCVRTAPATLMAVQHDGQLFPGQADYVVNVPGVPGALCALYADGTLYGAAATDAAGTAVIHMENPPAVPGALTLTVTAYNKVPQIEAVQVLPPNGPFVVYGGNAILDANDDADGEADAGEAVEVDLGLKNIGLDTATGISATLASEDPYVEIALGAAAYPDIPPDSTVSGLEPFAIAVSGAVPDQHAVPFQVHVTGNEGEWNCNFNVVVAAPVLEDGAVLIDDSAPGGNGNGVVDPGETFYIQLMLENVGHAGARALAGTLTCRHPGVQVLDAEGECLEAPAGGAGLLSAFQAVTVPGLPSPSFLTFDVAITGPAGFAASLQYKVSVGPWADNAEADLGWTLGIGGDTATSGQWVRAEPVGTTQGGQQAQTEYDHTPDPASLCFVTGNGAVGGAAGDSDVDGGRTTLLSPIFHLQDAVSATLEYWRWYTNNLGNNPGEDYWDVAVTSDGTTWVPLEHTTASANEWTHFSFELTNFIALTDQVRLRFAAADENLGSLVEAAVDDVVLTVVLVPAADVPSAEGRPLTGILSLSPNPIRTEGALAYRTGRAGATRLQLYDVSGRLVRTLVDRSEAAGEYAVSMRAQGLASGIYFVRLETPELIQVKQVAILR